MEVHAEARERYPLDLELQAVMICLGAENQTWALCKRSTCYNHEAFTPAPLWF